MRLVPGQLWCRRRRAEYCLQGSRVSPFPTLPITPFSPTEASCLSSCKPALLTRISPRNPSSAKRYERLLKAHDISPSTPRKAKDGGNRNADNDDGEPKTPASKKRKRAPKSAAIVKDDDDDDDETPVKKEPDIKTEQDVKKEEQSDEDVKVKEETKVKPDGSFSHCRATAAAAAAAVTTTIPSTDDPDAATLPRNAPGPLPRRSQCQCQGPGQSGHRPGPGGDGRDGDDDDDDDDYCVVVGERPVSTPAPVPPSATVVCSLGHGHGHGHGALSAASDWRHGPSPVCGHGANVGFVQQSLTTSRSESSSLEAGTGEAALGMGGWRSPHHVSPARPGFYSGSHHHPLQQ